MLVTALPAIAFAVEPVLIAGGITTLPPAPRLGPNLVADGDFELAITTTPWWTDRGWSMDLLVHRTGRSSLRLSGADLIPYSQRASQNVTLRKGSYRLSGWIKTSSLGTNRAGSGVRLTVTTNDGGRSSPVIAGTKDWTFFDERQIVIGSDQVASVRLEAYGDPSGTAWFDDVRLEQELPQPLDVFMLYPNFRGMLFDDQEQVLRFEAAVTPPVNDFRRYQVVATLREETGTVVVNTVTVAAAPRIVVEISAVGLRYGVPYLAELKLVDGTTRATVYAAPARRVSRVTAETRDAMTVSVDDRNRILLRGEPRFVLGVYDSSTGYGTTDAFWEQTLWSPTGARRLGAMPINFYLNYHLGGISTTALDALVANLQKHDAVYLQTANCFNRSRSSLFPTDRYDSYVLAFAEAGGAGYYTVDECVPSMVPGTMTQYLRLARLHPDSVTVGTLNASNALPLWRDAVDVLMTDPYPLWGAEPSTGYRHSIVADWTERARLAVSDARPTMTVLQFFQSTSNSRWPTWADLRNHAYMAIVEGARGLWWWSVGGRGLAWVCEGWCAAKVTYMNNLASVVKEIASLEAVLLADDRPDLLGHNSNPTAIRTLVKQLGARTYVFAYNYTATSAAATFTPRSAPAAVTVHGESRTLRVTSGAFTDAFDPYEAHVYVIDSTTPLPEPSAEPSPEVAPLTALSPEGPVDSATPTYRWSPWSGATWDVTYELRVIDAAGRLTRTRFSAATAGCAGGVGVCSVVSPVALPPGAVLWSVGTWVGEMRVSNALTFHVGASVP
jgi:hypothetical protein